MHRFVDFIYLTYFLLYFLVSLSLGTCFTTENPRVKAAYKGILLLGPHTNGKSTFGNFLMRNDTIFEVCNEANSDPPCTKNVTTYYGDFCNHDVTRW